MAGCRPPEAPGGSRPGKELYQGPLAAPMQSKTGTMLFQVGPETETQTDRLDKSCLALEQCVAGVPRHCPKPALATASAPWYITHILPLCEDTRHAPHPRPPLLRLRWPDPSRIAHRGQP